MIEVTERRRRRRKKLLDGLKEMTECWQLKRKHQIAICEEIAFEEPTDLS
jgi:hypothetical protein